MAGRAGSGAADRVMGARVEFERRRMERSRLTGELREEVAMQAPRGITDPGGPPSESSSERTRRTRKGKRRR